MARQPHPTSPAPLTAGSRIVFAGDKDGMMLFDVMRRAGLLATYPEKVTGNPVFGTDREDGSIAAHLTGSNGIRAAYAQVFGYPPA